MRKPIKLQSRLYTPLKEISEMYGTIRELNSLIRDTDPRARLNVLSAEIEVLRVKASKIRVNYMQLKRQTDKALKDRDRLQKRLQLLKNRKKVNQLLALATKLLDR